MNKLYIYNETYWSLVSFPDSLLDSHSVTHSRLKKDYLYTPDEIERISLSRTKRHIKEIALCNGFEYFFTSTVNSSYADRFSLTEVQDKIKKICHKIKRKNKDFKYIFITEKHKDGAFHFHGLCKNIDLYVNDNGYYSSSDFDLLGFNSFSKIRDYNKCCNYITKYISKDCVKNENNQIYFCSRGLSRCSSEDMSHFDLKKIFPNCFENEYCQKVDFDISRLDSYTKTKLYNYFIESDCFLQKDNNFFTNLLQILTKFKINFYN